MSAVIADVGGRTFVFDKLGVFDAIDVEVAILKAIGEPLFAAFAAGKKVEGSGAADRLDAQLADQSVAEDKPAPAPGSAGAWLAKLGVDEVKAATMFIRTLATNMKADEIKATMRTTFKSVELEGKPIDAELTFNGRDHKEPWEVFIKALRVNFGDFLPAGLFASLPGTATKK